MAFTFDPALADDVSKVRDLIGDIVEAGHLLPDATINAYLANGTVETAAARAARGLAARFAGLKDSSQDGQSEKASHLYRHYSDMALRLEKAASAAAASASVGQTGFSGLFVGGTTAQEVEDARHDETLATNAFPPRW